MITYKRGNLLDVKSGIIVHGCNAAGIMGSGVAKQVKKIYPGAYEKYLHDIRVNYFSPGDVSTYCAATDELYILSAITQKNYGRESDTRYVSYDAVDECFKTIFKFSAMHALTVHIPLIGAGLGGGSWKVISSIIEEQANQIYKPQIVCWEL